MGMAAAAIHIGLLIKIICWPSGKRLASDLHKVTKFTSDTSDFTFTNAIRPDQSYHATSTIRSLQLLFELGTVRPSTIWP